MSVSGITGSSDTSSISELLRLAQLNAQHVETNSTETEEDDVTLSGPGELLSKLRQLQEEDPEQFKIVAKELAEQLQTMADEMGGTEGEMLSSFASDLLTASETGDLSAMRPKPPQGGGMPPGGTYGMENGKVVMNNDTEDENSFQTLGAIFAALSDELDDMLNA
ncbi:hypothetical protein [Aminiphilus circumscriptus]|uniref:hypothetical protein n=1 Tax=Aminiphilus circumscriptus TaxID=290732 RepID=UPI0004785E17|nr:hypothetical protein [Aminiphilus circumscriptus]